MKSRSATRHSARQPAGKPPSTPAADSARPHSNQSMQRLLGAQSPTPAKPPLRVGAVTDPLEAEADHAAAQAMASPAAGDPSPLPAQRSRRTAPLVQASGAAPPSVGRTLAQPGSRLDAGLQRDMGQRFGHDFSQVRVHTGTLASQSAHELDAQAYTVGHNVVFGAGRYAPHTSAGRSLVAHELAHTLQQHVGAHGPGSQGEWVQRAPKPQTRPNASEPAVLDVIKKTLTRKGLPFSTEVEIEVSNIKGVKGKVKLRFDVVYQGDRLYLVEAKGADPDSLTDNQRLAHRALQEHGGTAKVTQVGGTPPGATRVRDVVALVKGHTWQIKPGEMQHVNGRFTASVKPQAVSQPNSMVVTAWEGAMDAKHTDAVPRKPGDVRVLKPNQREDFVPQSRLSDPTLTPQNKPKPKTPQWMEHPKKPPSPLRLGSFDDEDGLRVPGRRRGGAGDASGGRQRARIGAAAQADGPRVAEEPKRARIADPLVAEAKREVRAVDDVLADEADKQKPKSTQRFEYPEKPTAHPRPGSLDEETGRPARGRQADPNRGPGGTTPFFRKREQTKPIPQSPPVSTSTPEVEVPKAAPTAPVGLKPDASSAFRPGQLALKVPRVKLSALPRVKAPSFRSSVGTGVGAVVVQILAGAAVNLLSDEALQSTIEKETSAGLHKLQSEFDVLLQQSPKQIHAVVNVTVTVHHMQTMNPKGPPEVAGLPKVEVAVSLATEGVATSQQVEREVFVGMRVETKRQVHSFLICDVQKELARQEVARQDALLLAQQHELMRKYEEAEKTKKTKAKRKPVVQAEHEVFDLTQFLRPAAPPPLAFLPWPQGVAQGSHKEQENISKATWEFGRKLLQETPEPEQVQHFLEEVTVYRGMVQKMSREFNHDGSLVRLHKQQQIFDKRMEAVFKKLQLDYPKTQ